MADPAVRSGTEPNAPAEPPQPSTAARQDLGSLPPPVAPAAAPAPGWYAEPGSGRQRYWDGNSWGEYTPSASAGAPASEGKGIQTAGYICAMLAAVLPLIGLAGLILGILTATKRGRGGHGAAIIILSIVVAGISSLVYFNIILHHAAQSSGSCYYDPSGNYTCP